MFRKIMFAMVPMALVVSFVSADDSLLNLNLAEINDAAIEIDTASLDDLDVDGLAADAGSEDSEDAIEACFRRFGYRHRGYGYGYGYGYGGCYRPYYSYQPCYPTYYCYRPVHHYTYPVITYRSYWGCY
jgi:hypothetical protein